MGNPFKSFGRAIKAVAPTLGKIALDAAPGGSIVRSLAESGVKAVADRLGLDTSEPNAVAAALNEATPEQLIRIKEIEQQTIAQARELGLKKYLAYTADIQDARKHSTNQPLWFKSILSFLPIIAFVGMTAFLIEVLTIEGVELTEAVYMLIGSILTQLFNLTQAVYNYHFGASAQADDVSEKQSTALTHMMDRNGYGDRE